MNIINQLKEELASETATTLKFLALVPFGKSDWAPHEKSMKMMDLAAHIADLSSWPKLGIETEELDFATAPYNPAKVENNEQLVALMDKNTKESLESLSTLTEADLDKPWVLRTGEQIHAEMTKYGIIRVALNQITHHRAQLGVYLRILDIPIPGSYGPSADEQSF